MTVRVSLQRYLLLGNLIVCAAEDCPRKAGGCWNQFHLSWIETFYVAGRTFTLRVFDEDAYIYNYIRQVNVCRVSYTSCVTSYDLPMLINMSMACSSFFS